MRSGVLIVAHHLTHTPRPCFTLLEQIDLIQGSECFHEEMWDVNNKTEIPRFARNDKCDREMISRAG